MNDSHVTVEAEEGDPITDEALEKMAPIQERQGSSFTLHYPC